MSTSPAQALPKKPWYQYLTKEDRKAFFAAWIGVRWMATDFVLMSLCAPRDQGSVQSDAGPERIPDFGRLHQPLDWWPRAWSYR